jgi:hypothetical protein
MNTKLTGLNRILAYGKGEDREGKGREDMMLKKAMGG